MSTIDNPEPPLFLRFINLLINDAIFLLDEALDVSKTNFVNIEKHIIPLEPRVIRVISLFQAQSGSS
jgi:hypothetical protein